MSLLPQTLLNATTNEDQTLEIHSEILEPLSHSQNISRFEIPHKNVLDSDSQLIWKVFWDGMNLAGGTDHRADATLSALPFADAGLYSTINRARLYVDGVIVSELNEVGKFLTLKNNFRPHEVKVEKHDLFSYANHNLENIGGQIAPHISKIRKSTGDRSLGLESENYLVECSVRLGDLFGILEGAQLDTNSIMGKIMIEIDWNVKGKNNNVSYIGTALNGADINTVREVKVEDPRLILDFLTYNDEVNQALKQSIFGEGGGLTMPFKEVALVRKTINAGAVAVENSEDFFIGMTGRAVQKIWVQKVCERPNPTMVQQNNLMGDLRSDLLTGQRWNCKINDLMIFDRDCKSRAEEFNYVEQGGEGQFTCAPGEFERRSDVINPGYQVANNLFVADAVGLNTNASAGNLPIGVDTPYTRYEQGVDAGANGQGQYRVLQGDPLQLGVGGNGAGDSDLTVPQKLMGRKNYLCVPCGKYASAGTNPASAIRVGSTPIIFTLQYNGANDADTTARAGVVYFFVEYLKQMNLNNGEIRVADL